MEDKTKKKWLFTGLGFALGTAGLAVLKSDMAKKGYVRAMATGMKVKKSYQEIVEDAKAEYEDMVQEATYISVSEAEQKEACELAKEAKKAK